MTALYRRTVTPLLFLAFFALSPRSATAQAPAKIMKALPKTISSDSTDEQQVQKQSLSDSPIEFADPAMLQSRIESAPSPATGAIPITVPPAAAVKKKYRLSGLQGSFITSYPVKLSDTKLETNGGDVSLGPSYGVGLSAARVSLEAVRQTITVRFMRSSRKNSVQMYSFLYLFPQKRFSKKYSLMAGVTSVVTIPIMLNNQPMIDSFTGARIIVNKQINRHAGMRLSYLFPLGDTGFSMATAGLFLKVGRTSKRSD